MTGCRVSRCSEWNFTSRSVSCGYATHGCGMYEYDFAAKPTAFDFDADVQCRPFGSSGRSDNRWYVLRGTAGLYDYGIRQRRRYYHCRPIMTATARPISPFSARRPDSGLSLIRRHRHSRPFRGEPAAICLCRPITTATAKRTLSFSGNRPDSGSRSSASKRQFLDGQFRCSRATNRWSAILTATGNRTSLCTGLRITTGTF